MSRLQEHTRDLARAAEEARRQERERQRLERIEKREAFRRVLLARVDVEGGFNALSTWKDCSALFSDTEEAKALASVGITPQDIFEGVVHDLILAYKADKKVRPEQRVECVFVVVVVRLLFVVVFALCLVFCLAPVPFLFSAVDVGVVPS